MGYKVSSGSGGVLSVVAGEDIGGHRAVYVGANNQAFVCSSSDLSTRNCIGITLSAVTTGNPVRVAYVGTVTEQSWSWTSGDPLYVGPTGLLTQTPPSAGYSLLFGFALTPQKITITLEDSVELAS